MENKRFPTLLGTWKNHHLLWPKILYDCTQNLVRLRIYKTLTRTREVKQAHKDSEHRPSQIFIALKAVAVAETKPNKHMFNYVSSPTFWEAKRTTRLVGAKGNATLWL